MYRERDDKKMEDSRIDRWSRKDVCRVRGRGVSECERVTFRERYNGEDDD
jgi:hypothetical protein